MRNYDNPYFGIEIEFPESWKCRYWGNRANPHQFSHHQAGYDDLPSEPGSFKELFSAHRAIKSHSIMGTMIAMAAFYKPADFDISDERDVFDCEIKREVGEFIVHGKLGKFLYRESNIGNFVSYSSLYCWEHQPKIWMFSGIQGDTPENYQEALSVFNNMHVR